MTMAGNMEIQIADTACWHAFNASLDHKNVYAMTTTT